MMELIDSNGTTRMLAEELISFHSGSRATSHALEIRRRRNAEELLPGFAPYREFRAYEFPPALRPRSVQAG